MVETLPSYRIEWCWGGELMQKGGQKMGQSQHRKSERQLLWASPEGGGGRGNTLSQSLIMLCNYTKDENWVDEGTRYLESPRKMVQSHYFSHYMLQLFPCFPSYFCFSPYSHFSSFLLFFPPVLFQQEHYHNQCYSCAYLCVYTLVGALYTYLFSFHSLLKLLLLSIF